MPPFPSSFPPKRELIETFDFTDIATGLGFETYFGTAQEDSVDNIYLLLPFAVNSGGGDSNNSFNAFTKRTSVGTTTLTFNTSVFNLPRTVKGNAYVSFGLNGNSSLTGRATATLSIVDSGGTPTNISSTFTTRNMGNSADESQLLELPLTQTTIKKGEKLRLVFELVFASGSGTLKVHHNNLSSTNTEIFKLLIPFRIES